MNACTAPCSGDPHRQRPCPLFMLHAWCRCKPVQDMVRKMRFPLSPATLIARTYSILAQGVHKYVRVCVCLCVHACVCACTPVCLHIRCARACTLPPRWCISVGAHTACCNATPPSHTHHARALLHAHRCPDQLSDSKFVFTAPFIGACLQCSKISGRQSSWVGGRLGRLNY